jgi:BMFP domain-containing protein YqiC
MMMAEYSLDLLGPVIMAMRDDLAEIKQRLSGLEDKGGQHSDEMTVLSGLVMRYAGEHIAWGGVQSELRKLRERVAVLEDKV